METGLTEDRVRRVIAKIMQGCGRANRESILKFDSFLEGLGLSTSFRYGYLSTLYSLDRFLGGKSFKHASEGEILEFLRRHKPVTRATYATRIKSFYRWLFYGTWRRGRYPKIVENLPTSVRKRELPVKSVNDILTQEEVLKMIDAAEATRDKCLVAMLYDTGARPGEIANLRIRDVRLNDEHGEVIVNGKTGTRRIPLTISVPYVRRWLNEHPERDNGEAMLFAKRKAGRGGEGLTTSAINALIRKLARRAGIGKRVYPYIFRHSRLTELANVLREQQLKAFAGWTGGSRMAEVYVKLSGLDIDDPLLSYYGLGRSGEKRPLLRPRTCPRCGRLNPPNVTFCESCGGILDDKGALLHRLEAEEALKREIESLKELVYANVKALVESLVLRDPDSAKRILGERPDLLKRYILARDPDFIAEYCRKKGVGVDEFVEKEAEAILSSEERYVRFVQGIILKDVL